MAIHVAILKPAYVRLILDGVKTVESRLYRTPMPPIGAAHVGERVYVKQSAGPFRAVARIAAVKEYHDLTPDKVAALAARYNRAVCGDANYWRSKRDARYATFIRLTDVQPTNTGPMYAKSMRAWHVIDETPSQSLDYVLTRGGLRNRYARWPGNTGSRRFTLLLPDGVRIDTDLTKGRMFRWRGWGSYYQAHAMRPGDRVRLVALGQDRFRVQFLRHA